MVFDIEPMVLVRLMVFVHGISLPHMVFLEKMDLESIEHLYIGCLTYCIGLWLMKEQNVVEMLSQALEYLMVNL